MNAALWISKTGLDAQSKDNHCVVSSFKFFRGDI
jgi:hypothetical protein